MKFKVDSYVLEYDEEHNKYYISFEDSIGNECEMEIDEGLFNVYKDSKKKEIKLKNEKSRHLEHSEQTDNSIYVKAFYKPKSVEDEVIDNINGKILKEARKELTETQNKRIELHIIQKKSLRDLAKIENVRKKQIEKSINLGLKKIRKIFINRGGQNPF